jgi:hypothetical protein
MIFAGRKRAKSFGSTGGANSCDGREHRERWKEIGGL